MVQQIWSSFVNTQVVLVLISFGACTTGQFTFNGNFHFTDSRLLQRYGSQMEPTTRVYFQLPSTLEAGQSHRFMSTLARIEDPAHIFSGATGTVTFSLSVHISFGIAPPVGDFVVDAATGSIFAEPTAEYNATYTLFGTDGNGTGTSVRILNGTFWTRFPDTFDPRNGPNGAGCAAGRAVDVHKFDSRFECDCHGTKLVGANCNTSLGCDVVVEEAPQLHLRGVQQSIPSGSNVTFAFHNRTKWTLGETYAIAPVTYEEAYVGETLPRSYTNVTFSLKWNEISPRGFYIDGLTAEMLVQMPHTVQILSGQLIAEACCEEAKFSVVANLTFNVTHADTEIPEYGPQGKDCRSSDERRDIIEYDQNFTCECESNFTGQNCEIYTFTTKEPADVRGGDESTARDAAFVAVGALLIAIVILMGRFRRDRYKSRQPHSFADMMRQLHERGLQSARFSDTDEDGPPVELSRRDIELQEQLGQGNFGIVYKAVLTVRMTGSLIARGVPTDVAVKTLQNEEDADSSAREDFLREAAITWLFKHKNVVQMYGVVTYDTPYLLVLEFCARGELREYLQSDANELSIMRQFGFLQDIAAGMEHLVSLGFIHRDLASRNVLLDKNLVAKICDFGLGRNTNGSNYYAMNQASKTMLPLRWSDPEVLLSSRFSEMTDVWSYGITAIEIFTHGATPYAAWSNALVIERVCEGYRIPRPESCPDCVYKEVILPCWAEKNGSSSERPNFRELVQRLSNLKPKMEVARKTALHASLAFDDEARSLESYNDGERQYWETGEGAAIEEAEYVPKSELRTTAHIMYEIPHSFESPENVFSLKKGKLGTVRAGGVEMSTDSSC